MSIKKVFIFTLVVAMAFLIIFLLDGSKFFETESPEPVTPTAIPTISNPYKESFEGFRLYWVEVRGVGKISLYSNLVDKKTSLDIFEEKSCQYLISAGFYNKQDKHIGLFVANNKKISESIDDNFFDGYFYIDASRARISLTEPASSSLAVQSGPVIMLDNRFLIKNYTDDDYSRRILIGTTRSGSVVYIAMYGDNQITGPRLADIQNVVEELEEKSQIDIVDLINLDGGSHSAFITESLKISEFSTIGGYFCIAR